MEGHTGCWLPPHNHLHTFECQAPEADIGYKVWNSRIKHHPPPSLFPPAGPRMVESDFLSEEDGSKVVLVFHWQAVQSGKAGQVLQKRVKCFPSTLLLHCIASHSPLNSVGMQSDWHAEGSPPSLLLQFTISGIISQIYPGSFIRCISVRVRARGECWCKRKCMPFVRSNFSWILTPFCKSRHYCGIKSCRLACQAHSGLSCFYPLLCYLPDLLCGKFSRIDFSDSLC